MKKIELLHGLRLYATDVEMVHAALKAANHFHSQRAVVFEKAFLAGGIPEIGKRYLIPESELIVIANGLATIEDGIDYKFGAPKHSAWETLYHRMRRHLGKEFCY